jgi:hypothetical protein
VGQALDEEAAVRIALGDRHAYVGLSRGAPVGSPSELVVVARADPTAPPTLGRVQLPPQLGDMALDGSRLYVTTGRTVTTVDVSDPRQPRVLGASDFDGWVGSVAAADGFLYVGVVTGDPVLVFEAGADGALEPVGRLADPWSRPIRLELAGATLYGFGLDQLRAIDVRDPRRPRVSGRLENDAFGTRERWLDLAVDGGLLYLLSREKGLTILRPELQLRPAALYLPLALARPAGS